MTAFALTLEGEKVWLRVKKHLEWTEGFLVGFIFCGHPQVVGLFRDRLAEIFRARVTRLEFVLPENPDELFKNTIGRLVQPQVHETTQPLPPSQSLPKGNSEQ